MISGGVIENELVARYVTGHPVSLATTAMFCVGLAALILSGKNAYDQWWAYRKINLDVSAPNPQANNESSASTNSIDSQTDEHEKSPADESDRQTASQLLEHLDGLPKRFREFYLWTRTHNALDFIRRNDSTLGLDSELKYLSETDMEKQQDSFALVRILIWATPMLGFLGTVLGISEALGSINVGPENDFQQMLAGLRKSLYVAFDTTALALTFSILLMFLQFIVDRFDSHVLENVDGQTRNELDRHFQTNHLPKEPATIAVEQIGNSILKSIDKMTHAQSEIWKASLDSSIDQWQQSLAISDDITKENHEHVRQSLVEALEKAGDHLNQSVEHSVEKAEEQMEHRWQQMQVAMSDNARLMQDQQDEMAHQSSLMSDAISRFEKVVQSNFEQNQLDASEKDRLCELIDSWQNALVEMKSEEAVANRELKLRIVRPAGRAA